MVGLSAVPDGREASVGRRPSPSPEDRDRKRSAGWASDILSKLVSNNLVFSLLINSNGVLSFVVLIYLVSKSKKK